MLLVPFVMTILICLLSSPAPLSAIKLDRFQGPRTSLKISQTKIWDGLAISLPHCPRLEIASTSYRIGKPRHPEFLDQKIGEEVCTNRKFQCFAHCFPIVPLFVLFLVLFSEFLGFYRSVAGRRELNPRQSFMHRTPPLR